MKKKTQSKKTFFVCSDLHGFFDIFQDALDKAGFDTKDPSHIIIMVGDMFDRGPQALEMYNFFRSLPKNRRVLIRGNHEALLRDLVAKGYPQDHDYSNGTYGTLLQLAETGYTDGREFTKAYYKATAGLSYGSPEYMDIQTRFNNIRKSLYTGKVEEVLQWIASDEWVDYYELDEYIFVHSFIPVHQDWEAKWGTIPSPLGKPTYRADWREATSAEWEDASWGCPWRQYLQGLFKPEEEKGKILVCGHWHAFDFRVHLDHQLPPTKKEEIDFGTYVSPHLIALDTCTALSHQVNIYKIEKRG